MRDPDEVPNKFYNCELSARDGNAIPVGYRANHPGNEPEVYTERCEEPPFEFLRREITPLQHYMAAFRRLPTDPE